MTSQRAPMADQNNDFIKAQLDGQMGLLCLFTEAQVRNSQKSVGDSKHLHGT